MTALKSNTLRLIAIAAKNCDILDAVKYYQQNKDIVSAAEFEQAYTDGVDAYYAEILKDVA